MPRPAALPYELGIIRNHYVGRTFIQPTQSVRELGVRLKHSANRAAIAGKRIVLVDDSLVRGTTSVKIVRMMREAGAKEVHFRIASPPITHPGLLRHRHAREGEAPRRHPRPRGHARLYRRGLAGLPVHRGHLPLHGREAGAIAAQPQFTDHCFTGDYPTPLTDLDRRHAASRLADCLGRSRLSTAMDKPLANRVAVVTGASRGIGRAAALALAEAGAHIVALARTQGALEELDDEIRAKGASATLVPVNLKDSTRSTASARRSTSAGASSTSCSAMPASWASWRRSPMSTSRSGTR